MRERRWFPAARYMVSGEGAPAAATTAAEEEEQRPAARGGGAVRACSSLGRREKGQGVPPLTVGRWIRGLK